jgi:diaminohydroxyphosphoribosylaminopyrimidine deaminase/5-amino-6-(5-phosphoribosylamino)uracil reductase
VIDRFLKLNEHIHLFDGTQKTLCYNVLKHEELPNLSLVRIAEENFLPHLIDDLQKRKIQSVIVEGGSQTLQSFIDAQLWDEARIFVSKQLFHDGIEAPAVKGMIDSNQKIQSDWLKILRPR